MKAFITATGTGVGKTYVTCGLIRQLRQEGCRVRALKPVISGFENRTAAESDPARILSALGLPFNGTLLDEISPWRFAAPLSPDWAAQLEGRRIDYEQVVALCRERACSNQATLIEGIGGVMVPLDDSKTVLDLIGAVGLPVILVAGSYLGTLSHTLTALSALQSRGLRTLVAISESVDGLDADRTASAIASRSGTQAIVLRRMDPPAHDAAFASIVRAVRLLQATCEPGSR